MRICMISSEFAPFAKAGGLGDAVSALAAELHRGGHELRIFVPRYSSIDPEAAGMVPVDFLQDISLATGAFGLQYSMYTAPQQNGLWVHFIDCPILYDRPGLYTSDSDEHLRFIMLSRGALECCQRMGWSPDIVQCHDWQSALVPLYLKSLYAWDSLFANTRTVFSIHNLGYQGGFQAGILPATGLSAYRDLLHQDDLNAGAINFLRHGIIYADALTTVSPTYAREICTPEYGMGMDDLLRQRHESLFGILNGVDYETWSPEKDPLIPFRYSRSNLRGKAANKARLQEQLGLRQDPDTPLAGIVSRLVAQKGFSLAYEALPRLLADGRLQLAVLGSGESRYEEFFTWLQHEFPGRAAFWRGFNNPLAHLIEAGSDMFLMPSLYEPCGLNQMYSLRYGTVPVVRKTGGLADTVTPHTRDDGNGIVFEHADQTGFGWAMDTAVELYGQRERWNRLIANGMRQDFSWEKQAGAYVTLFRHLAETSTA